MIEKMSTRAKQISAIVAALTTTLGISYGAVEFVDTRYAHTSDFVQLKQRVTLAELKDLLRKSLDNLYYYRDLARKYPEDKDIAQKLKDAEEEVAYIKKQIRELEEKERAGD